jgi:hypothetical protein
MIHPVEGMSVPKAMGQQISEASEDFSLSD